MPSQIAHAREQKQQQKQQLRVSSETREILQDLKRRTGVSFSEIVDEAVDAFSRRYYLEAGNRRYEALRQNPELRREREEEQALRSAIESERLSRRAAQTAVSASAQMSTGAS